MAALRANARKVICIGRNYVDHITELNNPRRPEPFFFLKPSTSILPPGTGPIKRPPSLDIRHEVELAVIMGKDLEQTQSRQIDEQRIMDAIEGYAVAIDMTAGNLQEDAKRRGLPWTIAKGFDTFLPISEFIPKEKIPDPHSVHLHLSVKRKTPSKTELRQSDSTGLMIYRIPYLLQAIRFVMSIEKGDIILTGTPKGVRGVAQGDTIIAGARVDGEEIEEGKIKVKVTDLTGPPFFHHDQTHGISLKID